MPLPDVQSHPDPADPQGDVLRHFGGKYLSLTTFRRDGTGVATRVAFVLAGNRIVTVADAGSYTVRRIQAGAFVTLAPCTGRGRVTGPVVPARAELLDGRRVDEVEQLLREKYRAGSALTGPLRAFRSALHRQSARGDVVAISIKPL